MNDNFPLTFSREDWGIIIDGLHLEINRSFLRKKTSDECEHLARIEDCERLIKTIMNESNG